MLQMSSHHSDDIAQSNQATAVRASSAQPPKSHPLNLKKHGEVETNINLTVNRRLETGNRNLVFNNASPETNNL